MLRCCLAAGLCKGIRRHQTELSFHPSLNIIPLPTQLIQGSLWDLVSIVYHGLRRGKSIKKLNYIVN